MKRAWEGVEAELLEAVFFAHDPQAVRAAVDFGAVGMIDSLSVVAILEILAEAGGSEEGLDAALATDFVNLAAVRTLYERL